MSDSRDPEDRVRILIVEDDADLREMLRTSLADRYEVIGLSHGDDILGVLESFEPGLLILDINLPGINGIEVCRRIRARIKDLPILFMSIRGEDETFLKTFDAGGSAFISKPFEMGEMLDLIEESLGGVEKDDGRPWRLSPARKKPRAP